MSLDGQNVAITDNGGKTTKELLMDIEAIKEWREGADLDNDKANEIIDTLLAEVERLQQPPRICEICRDKAVLKADEHRDNLTIATEALEMVIYTSKLQSLSHEKYEVMAQHARTALERIKEMTQTPVLPTIETGHAINKDFWLYTFAGQAMQGMLANPNYTYMLENNVHLDEHTVKTSVAANALGYAKALLKELEALDER